MVGTANSDYGSDGPMPMADDAQERSRAARRLRQHDPEPAFSDDDLPNHWGLFGPESVTWRVHSDPLIGLAVLRSLILRVLHPEGLASVFATARRVDDPWERVAWAQRYLGVLTFGDSAEAAMAGARLRSVLMQVNGTATDGRWFRGDDPELLVWQHACQVQSFLEVTRRGGLDLGPAEQEAYVREQVRTAALYGLDPDEVPRSGSELTRYFRQVRPQLRMSHAARTFVGAVVAPTMPELMQLAQRDRPAWAPVAGLAWTSLPAWARKLYGTPPTEGPAGLSQPATTVALHSLRDSLRARTSHLDDL
jgi:uncharacterized protein (DUF2236 family)